MNKRELNHLVDNLTLFTATYLGVDHPKIPSYDDGEDAWVEFLKPALEAYFNKQQDHLEQYTFVNVGTDMK